MSTDDTTSSVEQVVRLTEAEWQALTQASFAGGAKAWRAEVEHIIANRVTKAKAAALREASDAFVAQQQAIARAEGRVAPWGEAAAFLDLRAEELEEADRG